MIDEKMHSAKRFDTNRIEMKNLTFSSLPEQMLNFF